MNCVFVCVCVGVGEGRRGERESVDHDHKINYGISKGFDGQAINMCKTNADRYWLVGCIVVLRPQ